MRRLMWFSMGFTVSCITGVYFVSGIWLFLLMVFALAATVAIFFVKSKAGKRTFAVLLGLTVGIFWLFCFDSSWLRPAREYDGQCVEGTIEITDYSWDRENGIAAEGKLSFGGNRYRVVYYGFHKEPLFPGDRVKGSFRLRFTADGGEKAPTYHQGKGIFLLAFGDENTEVARQEEIPGTYFAATFRKRILQTLDMLFPEDTSGFARALLLGDTSKLTFVVDNAFQKSGIRHVIAVSGLHVSVLFGIAYTFCGKRRVLTAIVGIPVLFLFALVTGLTPSITRACIMQGLMILALLLKKEYDPPTALAFAVLVMLAVNPLTITSVSFQLSVGCMVGIFLFSGRIREYLLDEKRLGPAKGKSVKARLTCWLVSACAMSLSATVTTTPLCAYYFGYVSIIGILTNLLTLWVITFIFCAIVMACLLALVWFPLGAMAAEIASVPMRYVLFVSLKLSELPIGAVFVNNPYIIAWLIFAYILISVFLAYRKKHPVMLGVCLFLGLCAAVALSWIEPRLDDYRVTVLDVGQGQCVLLQYENKYYVVDCGGDYADSAADIAIGQLLSQGVFKLDGLILTHYDADHAGGAEGLLSRIPAKTLYLPDADVDNKIRNALEAGYADIITWLETGEILKIEDFPATLFAAETETTGNESSLCILFQPKDCDILITGDRNEKGEQELLAQTQLPLLELLVVGHHGSGSSTGFDLLRSTMPEMAAISVGEKNAYGHPTQEVLDRLSMIDCQIWRTDKNGTLIFRG